MPFVGPLSALLLAFVTASACEILGNQRTRGFTRFGFGVVAARAMGVTVRGLASFGGDVWGLLL
jgi:hypothetical protein